MPVSWTTNLDVGNVEMKMTILLQLAPARMETVSILQAIMLIFTVLLLADKRGGVLQLFACRYPCGARVATGHDHGRRG